jgi:succinate dehydrogenase/fumarate reductase flavoprotein subunit
MLIGEQSPIKVDHDMQTTIPGLYAIGDASYCGSAAPGAVPAPPGRNRGSGILNAVFAGISCAESAASHAKSAAQPEVDKAQVEKSFERVYAPLERESGCTCKDVIRKVQAAMCPMEYSVYMHGDRIAEAMKIVQEAKELVPKRWFSLPRCTTAPPICARNPAAGSSARTIRRWTTRTG